MKIRIHYVLILMVFAGCATLKPIPPEKLSKINNIGVVSILEDNLRMQYTGFFARNNYIEEIPAHQWDMDGYVAEAFRDAITTHTHMKFLPLDYDVKPLLAVYQKGTQKDQIRTALSHIAANHHLDAMIFVKRAWFQEPIMHNVKVSGYGVCKQSGISSMYLVADVTIYNAQTMASLAHFYLLDDKQVDNTYFTTDLSALTQDQQMNLKHWFQTAIRNEMNQGLMRCGVLPVSGTTRQIQ